VLRTRARSKEEAAEAVGIRRCAALRGGGGGGGVLRIIHEPPIKRHIRNGGYPLPLYLPT
jgi:hypothetical protein